MRITNGGASLVPDRLGVIVTPPVTNPAPSFHWAWAFQDPSDPLVGVPAYCIVVSDPNGSMNQFPYPQTATGKPDWGLFGFSQVDHSRTRNDTLGQLGGAEFEVNNGTQAQLQVAVPAGGTFDINVALGDLNANGTQYCYIYDDLVLVAQVNGVATTGGANHVLNLAGTNVAVGSWSFNTGKSSVVFSTGVCRVKFGSSSSTSSSTFLVTFEINQTA